MARYKYIDTNARFLAVDLASRQCLLRHAVETAYNEGGRLSSMESWTIAGKHDRRLMVDLEIRCYRGNVQP